MRYVQAGLLSVALLGVAGCQTDMQIRNLNKNGAYAENMWRTEGFSFESDTRQVILNFDRPPVEDVVDSDTYIAYISIPLHPIHGLQFNNPSFGVGWSDVSMSFSGIFDPTPEKIPYGQRVRVVPDDIFENTGEIEEITTGEGRDWSMVDPRYQAYAAALRDHLYQIDFAGAVDEHERTAAAPATPPAAAGVPLIREND